MASFSPSKFAALLALSVSVLILFLTLPTVDARRNSRYNRRRLKCESSPELVCVVRGTTGNTVYGNVTFTPVFRFDRTKGKKGYHVCNVRVVASIRGLAKGRHGFHIHTYGDLRDRSGASTGGHFSNPRGGEIRHGWHFSKVRHWGDIGNIVSSQGRVAKMYRLDKVISIPGIIGRGLTIHAGEDHGPNEQPSGAAGPRVAFGVIGIANPDYSTSS